MTNLNVTDSNQNKIIAFFLIFSFFILGFSLNFFNFTSFNDGIEYLFISEYLKDNFDLNNIPTTDYNKIFYTPQLGSTLLLTLLKIITSKYYFVLYLVILAALWVNLLVNIENYYVFEKLDKSILVIFIFLIFFQFDLLRASTSFYNEGIYYPLFISTFISLDNLIQKNIKLNFYNKINVFIFFMVGPFFQLIHFFILFSFLIIFIFNIKRTNIFQKTFIFFIPIVISKFIFAIYLIKLIGGGNEMTSINFSVIGSNIISNQCYNYQKFFNIFVTPLNLHLIFTNFRIPIYAICSEWSIREYIISFSLFLVFLYSFFKNFKANNFNILIISIIFTTFIARVIITDYDVRYNIYTNFFIIYFYLLLIKKALSKNLISRIILVALIFITCAYNLKNFTNINIKNFKGENTIFRKNVQTLNSLNTLKKIKFNYKLTNENKDYDFIISSFNSRFIYQVFKKQSCYLEEIKKCSELKDKTMLLIISEKEKDFLKNVSYNNNNIIEYIHKY